MDLDNIKCITNDKVNNIINYIDKLLETNNLDILQDIINNLLNKKNNKLRINFYESLTNQSEKIY